MSHALDFTIGRAAIAYSGQTPWHGHGIQLNPDSTLDEWRVAAGLDWEVEERKLYYSQLNDEGKRVPIIVPERKALVRSDSQDFLSIVSNKYVVAQPSKVFEFFRDLLKQNGLTMEVAGALDGGRKIWALARIDDSFNLFGRDTQVPYVLVATSFDGTLSTQAMLTIIRVVCNNTITAAGAYTQGNEDADDVYKVRHDKEFSIREAHGKLGLNEDAWLEYKRNIEKLAQFNVSPDEILEFFYDVAGQGKDIVRNDDNGNVISFPEPSRVTKQFINAYKNGPGADLPTAKGTMFGALNAVTFYQDHLAPASDRGKRFNSATFGGGNVRKQHAFKRALEALEAA